MAEQPLWDAAFDDLGLCHEHVHEVPTRHEVEQEIEVILVLEARILADAEGVGRVARDGLLAHDVLRALHHRRLAHLFEGVLALRALLCTGQVTNQTGVRSQAPRQALPKVAGL